MHSYTQLLLFTLVFVAYSDENGQNKSNIPIETDSEKDVDKEIEKHSNATLPDAKINQPAKSVIEQPASDGTQNVAVTVRVILTDTYLGNLN